MVIASLKRRVASYCIDFIINAIVIFLLILLIATTEIISFLWRGSSTVVADIYVLYRFIQIGMVIMMYLTLYNVVLPYLNHGQTIGKHLFHIRVVRSDEFKADFICLLLREVVGKNLLSITTFGIAPIVSFLLMNYRKQDHAAIHDIIAHTKVVNTK